ncbi:hypothetical protein [Enterococcus thailandicus]|uniref:hypothetical protein n=1 Tax=Enterococcus thailandicus TaxID=417368 RepID=UPI0035DA4765
MKKKNLRGTITQLIATLTSHVGAGDSAHSAATSSNAGFLSAKDKIRYDRASGQRAYLAGGADILTLEPGHYDGYSFLNSPLSETDASMVSVDVTVGNNAGLTRKQIVFQRSHDGKTWEMVIHQNGVSSGWRIIERKKLIWSGTAKNSGTVIKLSDELSKFTSLEIEYSDTKTGNRIVKYPIYTTITLQSTNMSNASGSSTVEWFEIMCELDVDKITINHNRRLTFGFSSSLLDISEAAEMTIYKVYGCI